MIELHLPRNLNFVCRCVNGSRMYGINREDSDFDYTGVYISRDRAALYGFVKDESTVLEDAEGNDHAYWELRHFLRLLRKTTVKTVELLFNDKWLSKNSMFNHIIAQRKNLIESKTFFNAAYGYAINEINIALGIKTSDLGKDRKEHIKEYGFSPKNAAHALRILSCSTEFAKTGNYPVNVSEWKPVLATNLKLIREHPAQFGPSDIECQLQMALNEFNVAVGHTEIDWHFDADRAVHICDVAYERDEADT